MTMATVALPRPRIEVCRGPAHWVVGYRTMLHWQLASLRTLLPLLIGIQVLVGAGFVLGIALLFDDISPTAALYVSSGAPVMNLLMVGLLLGPQLVAQQKAEHSYDFLQALPVPRIVRSAMAQLLLQRVVPGLRLVRVVIDVEPLPLARCHFLPDLPEMGTGGRRGGLRPTVWTGEQTPSAVDPGHGSSVLVGGDGRTGHRASPPASGSFLPPLMLVQIGPVR
jgi:hypothetical protein